MKAIILAGGKGTRLQSVVSDIPKPMAPVGGKPFLEYLIRQLLLWQISEIILSVGYKKESIMSYFSNGVDWGAAISYIEESVPLGTGGAIKKAFSSVTDTDILILNGDSFFDADISALARYHHQKNATATMAILNMKETGRYGRVVVSAEGKIVSFLEKGNSITGLINTGIYILNRKILPLIPDGVVSFETGVLPQLVGNGLYGSEMDGFFIDIGIPSDYLYADAHPHLLRSQLRYE
ncbi:MAG TPA: nucleotidyltransferase family protein [Nitrospirota bacterium]|nr:nucleotidyltransferase family protein [Nitrospirota bacterium]